MEEEENIHIYCKVLLVSESNLNITNECTKVQNPWWCTCAKRKLHLAYVCGRTVNFQILADLYIDRQRIFAHAQAKYYGFYWWQWW